LDPFHQEGNYRRRQQKGGEKIPKHKKRRKHQRSWGTLQCRGGSGVKHQENPRWVRWWVYSFEQTRGRASFDVRAVQRTVQKNGEDVRRTVTTGPSQPQGPQPIGCSAPKPTQEKPPSPPANPQPRPVDPPKDRGRRGESAGIPLPRGQFTDAGNTEREREDPQEEKRRNTGRAGEPWRAGEVRERKDVENCL
jgi:hypothetical protein